MSIFLETNREFKPVQICNELLKKERLTDDLYKVALESVRDEKLSYRLTSARLNHLEAILLLKRSILHLGGEPDVEAGKSDAVSRVAAFKRDADHDANVINLLLEVEADGVEGIQGLANASELDPTVAQLVTDELAPRAQRNHRMLRKILSDFAAEARQREAAMEARATKRDDSLLLGDDDAAPFSVI